MCGLESESVGGGTILLDTVSNAAFFTNLRAMLRGPKLLPKSAQWSSRRKVVRFRGRRMSSSMPTDALGSWHLLLAHFSVA